MKLGLFLTPGAAMTAYEVGAVQALVQEGGLRFDVIAGSSAGVFNGAFTATGQIEQLVQLWSGWHTKDVLDIDWIGLLRGAVLWSPELMQERPYFGYIDKYIDEKRLLPGVRFRFNLANLNTGDQEFFEWPEGPFALTEGVKAAVSVPAVIEPREIQGVQWVDGFTVDGFPLEHLVLETGVERIFALGVAPRTHENQLYTNLYQTIMRAAKLNQFSETYLGIERARQTNELIQHWEADRKAIEQVIETLIEDIDLRAELLAEVERTYIEANFPYKRPVVEIIPILPEHEIDMFFGDYQPERSQRLLEQGRQDALNTLASLRE
jgi:predicted acylesterase/phospholipase RssA